MKDEFVLDASALLSILLDEAGQQRVSQILIVLAFMLSIWLKWLDAWCVPGCLW